MNSLPSRTLTVASLGVVVILWTVRYLPMVDYPQHLAQIALWSRQADPAWQFSTWYEMNWFTPYLLGYGAARLLEPLFGVETAMRIVLSLGLVGFPLAVRALLRRLGLDAEWSLGACFLVFGYSFNWGFFNYLLALPVAVVFLTCIVGLSRPGMPSGWETGRGAAMAVLLYFSHAMAWALMAPVAAILIRRGKGSWTESYRTLLGVLGPSVVLAGGWLAFVRWSEPAARQSLVLCSLEHLGRRFFGLPGNLFGETGAMTGWALLFLIVALGAASGMTLKRDPWSLLPFAVGSGWYFFGLFGAWGTSHLAERTVVFLPILLLPALEPGREPRLRWWRQALIVLVVGWLLMVGWRFRMFDREAREFEPVRAAVPAHSKVLGLIFLARSEYAPLYPYLHFPAYLQMDKPVMISFSFASFIPEIIRYRRDVRFGWTTGLSLQPLMHYTVPGMAAFRLDWRRDAVYDHVLVRAEYDVGPQILGDAPWRWKLTATNGSWWLYEKS